MASLVAEEVLEISLLNKNMNTEIEKIKTGLARQKNKENFAI